MGTVDDVASFIASGSTHVKGRDLFGYWAPDAPADRVQVTVKEEPGLRSVERFGANLPALVKDRVRIEARSTRPTGGPYPDPSAARRAAMTCWERLTTLGPSTASGVRYERFEPLSRPYHDGREADGRAVFAFSVLVWATPTTQA